ncbi:hypothetical protein EDB81DRAFT_907961 [Dactylonectria macrodidyma]|uniref:Protein kinase domain-containing protein n=1 Tax=Dactylonectria macrodidyma TaxID=307937 RepID=A0A9P9IM82_9HYPO|nr:hypothetical protein EDB81DRAFT_907961 [Dactylonectria macrodidyma]
MPQDFVPLPLQVGPTDNKPVVPSRHRQPDKSDTMQLTHKAALGTGNTRRGSIGVETADNNIAQKHRPTPPQRNDTSGTIHTTIQNRVRSWADAGSRVQIKGKLRLKEIGNRIKEPGPATELKQKITEALGKERSLRKRLYMASVTSHHPHSYRRRFLHMEDLQRVLGEDVVERQLNKCHRRRRTTGQLAWNSQGKGSAPVGIDQDIKFKVQTVYGKIAGNSGGKDSGLKSYLKILTILIWIKRGPMIIPFMDAQLCDDDLPLSMKNAKGSTPWKLHRKDGQEVPLDCFKCWGKSSFASSFAKFVEMQWVVLAPSFDHQREEKEGPQNLSNEHILPFTAWEKSTEGGFGKVYKVPRASCPEFALKKVRIRKPIDPKYEFNVLRKLRNDRHTHLISLLAAYIQHDAYHLIFPWAKADLLGYWKFIHPKPLESERGQNLVWLAEQCQGLADGLAFIHRYDTMSFECLLHPTSFPLKDRSLVRKDGENEVRRLFGRHGDIKPANILWFPSSDPSGKGILKITDFGNAEFSTQPEVDSGKRRDFFANSPTYRPPETDLQPYGGIVSASYDIWTLGCVYLEFLTWWLGGWIRVHEFADQRLDSDAGLWGVRMRNFRSDKFFSITEDEARQPEARVKTKVTEFMEELNGDLKSNDFVREFLKLIRSNMLIVVSGLEEDGRPTRQSSRNIANELDAMQKKHLLK